jgi:hypothetical protein
MRPLRTRRSPCLPGAAAKEPMPKLDVFPGRSPPTRPAGAAENSAPPCSGRAPQTVLQEHHLGAPERACRRRSIRLTAGQPHAVVEVSGHGASGVARPGWSIRHRMLAATGGRRLPARLGPINEVLEGPAPGAADHLLRAVARAATPNAEGEGRDARLSSRRCGSSYTEGGRRTARPELAGRPGRSAGGGDPRPDLAWRAEVRQDGLPAGHEASLRWSRSGRRRLCQAGPRRPLQSPAAVCSGAAARES